MTDQAFGARLKDLREKAGLTQAALAERAGMHRLGIAKLERGDRQPTWATVEALARALGVRCTAFEGTSGAAAAEEPEQPPPTPPAGKPSKPKKRRPKKKP